MKGFGAILLNLMPPSLCGNTDCKFSVQRSGRAYSLPDGIFCAICQPCAALEALSARQIGAFVRTIAQLDTVKQSTALEKLSVVPSCAS